MNLPNSLTVSRVILTALLIVCLLVKGAFWSYLAVAVFIIAAATDWLDGWLARRRGQTSDFGKLMDPIADKILVLGALVTFVGLNLIPAWMVIVVIVRESMVTGARLKAATRGVVIQASRGGKYKTVSQMAAIGVILLLLAFRTTVAAEPAAWSAQWDAMLQRLIYTTMLAAIVLTVISGATFFWRNRALILHG